VFLFSRESTSLPLNTTSVCSHPSLPLGISGHVDSAIRFWDFNKGECVKAMSGHGDAVTSIAVDPMGFYFASGSHDQSIRFWDLGSLKAVQVLDPHATHAKRFDEVSSFFLFL
jgi:striatin 1/3/4